MKSPSLISILAPACNYERYVEGCVRSVLVDVGEKLESVTGATTMLMKIGRFNKNGS